MTLMTVMHGSRARVGAVLGLLFALTMALACAASPATTAVTTQPATPLVDVPFYATPGLVKDNTLYASTSSTCATANAITPICTIGGNSAWNQNATTCVFTISSAALGLDAFIDRTVPQLYWCSNTGGSTPINTFNVAKMTVTPPFVFYNNQTTLTFNSATPVGTRIGFYSTDACTFPVVGTSTVTLGPSLSTDLLMSTDDGNTVYVCATVPSVTGGTVAISATTVFASSQYNIFTTTGLRYTNISIGTNSRAVSVSLSHDFNCLDFAQPSNPTTGTRAAMLNIVAPQGSYYFCTLIDAASGVYVPATSQFVVTEYGIQPRSLYTGMATQMRLTRSAIVAGTSYDAGLFMDPLCEHAVLPWSSNLAWSPTRTGTFYACVRPTLDPGPANTSRAGTITISGPPTLTFSRTPGVIGLGVVATFTRNNDVAGFVTVGLAETSTSGNTCKDLITQGTTESATALSVGMHIPATAPAQVVACISNPVQANVGVGEETNTAYYYPMFTYNLRSFFLTYDPLLINTDLAIALDPEVKFSTGTVMKLVPSSAQGCGAALGSNNNNNFPLNTATSSLTPVRFPTAGAWLLCVSEPTVLAGEFGLLRTLQVYGNAVVKPNGLVTGVPTTLTVTAIPPSTNVYLTAETACKADGSNTQVASAVSNTDANATLQNAKYGVEGSLLLCVRYRGEANSLATAGAFHSAGSIASAVPHVFPTVAIQGRTSKLSFLVPSTDLLVGGVAYLIEDTSNGGLNSNACSTTSAPTNAAYQLSIVDGTTEQDMPYASFTPSAGTTIGTQYLVCVGFTGGFTAAGTVRVEDAMTMTQSPTDAIAGLPVRATFAGAAFTALRPNRFSVIDASANCAEDLSLTTVYASGAIDGDGNTDYFIAPTTTAAVRVCVAQEDNLVSDTAGFSDGGRIDVHTFTAVSQFAVIGQPNDLQGSPIAENAAALFLAPCGSASACSASRATETCQSATTVFYTSPLQALPATAAEGPYVLCQQSILTGFTNVMVGATTPVAVVPAWSLTASRNPIRQYQAVDVTLAGGPTGASTGVTIPETYDLVVVPATTGCSDTSAASTSQTFAIKSSGSTSITVTSVEPVVDVVFCLQPSSDAADSFPVLQTTLQTYMTPTVILADTATTVTSASLQSSGLAKLSGTATCSDTVSSGNPQTISNYQSTLTVSGCGANGKLDAVFYCESTDGGASFANRGRMGLLRRSACADGSATATITSVRAAPAAPITDFGIHSDFLVNPRLSTSGGCEAGALLPANVTTLGYSPSLGASNTFFVCATPIGMADSVRFTTSAATFTVIPWAVTPTSVLSRYNSTVGVLSSTQLTINYKTPSQQTFISRTPQCGTALVSAPGFADADSMSTSISTTSVNGLLYVCTFDSLFPSKQILVANFLSVTPPTVLSASPAIIRGATYATTLEVQGTGVASTPLYSMHQGTDSGYTYASYYVSSARDVFLSQDSCRTLLPGTSTSYVNSANVAAFTTDSIAPDVTSAQLCTGTPAGNAVALNNVVVTSDVLYPSLFVTGTRATIFIPFNPNTEFYLSQSATPGDCSAVASTGLPSFTTDNDGYGGMALYTAGGAVPAPTGTYNLCFRSGQNVDAALARASSVYTALATQIQVTPQQIFDVRGLNYFVGVPGTMQLLDDLKPDYLLSGFATSRLCDVVDETYGSWVATSATTLSVTAATAQDDLYLCARAPINQTIVALPLSPRSITFQALGISLPPNNTMNTCDSFTIGRCFAPGGADAPRDAVMGAIYGSCCNLADRVNVVGQSSMSTPTNGGSGTCELQLDGNRVNAFAPATSFSLCAWSPSDESYCATLGVVQVTTDCTNNANRGSSKKLSSGELAAIIVCSILGGLLLIALILWIIWCCCCRDRVEDEDGYIDIDSGVDKDKQLVALRHMEVGEYYEGSSTDGSSRRHPLMYAPYELEENATESRSRTISNSRGRSGSSDSNNPFALLASMEEDQRDALTLQEARARYNLRLACNDGYTALLQAEKEQEIEIGFEDEGDGFAREAVPERRAVEDIDYEDTTYVEVQDERKGGSPVVQRRHVRSQSIESSRPSTPRRRESFLHVSEEDEERPEGTRTSTPQGTSRYPTALHASEESPHDPGQTPRPQLVIRHQTSRTSRNGPLAASEHQEHVTEEDDSINIDVPEEGEAEEETEAQEQTAEYPIEHDARDDDDAEDMEDVPQQEQDVFESSNATATAPSGYVNTVPPTRHEGDVPSPRGRVVARSLDLNPDEEGDVDAETNDMSSINAADGPQDPSAAYAMSFVPVEERQRNANDEEDDDDEDDDALNYTTTQRYHDELRFLLENEDSRRQRLSNWEEEDRAALVQDELDLRIDYLESHPEEMARYQDYQQQKYGGYSNESVYNHQPPPPPQQQGRHEEEAGEADDSGVEMLRDEDHAEHGYYPTEDPEEEEEEEEYCAPAIPADLPALPPAPRSAAAQQQYLDHSQMHQPQDETNPYSALREDDSDEHPAAQDPYHDDARDQTYEEDQEVTEMPSEVVPVEHEDAHTPERTDAAEPVSHRDSSPRRHLDSMDPSFGGAACPPPQHHPHHVESDMPDSHVAGDDEDEEQPARVVVASGHYSSGGYSQLHQTQEELSAPAREKSLPSPGTGMRYGDAHDTDAAYSIDEDMDY